MALLFSLGLLRVRIVQGLCDTAFSGIQSSRRWAYKGALQQPDQDEKIYRLRSNREPVDQHIT